MRVRSEARYQRGDIPSVSLSCSGVGGSVIKGGVSPFGTQLDNGKTPLSAMRPLHPDSLSEYAYS